MLKFGSHRIKGLILSLLIAALACGQATTGLPPNLASAEITLAASPTSATPLANDSPSNPPILIGTEYVTIDIPWRVALLADLLTPLGLTAAKPLPEPTHAEMVLIKPIEIPSTVS